MATQDPPPPSFESYLAYAPHGPGLECAVACYTVGDDVYGWFTGLRDYAYVSAFFLLEHFFEVADTVFLATAGSDLYGGWSADYGREVPALGTPLPIDDAVCHRLARVQETFANEWLWVRGTPGTAAEEAEYARDGIAVQDVNIRHHRLAKLSKASPLWTFASPGLNFRIVESMARRWPLDYRPD